MKKQKYFITCGMSQYDVQQEDTPLVFEDLMNYLGSLGGDPVIYCIFLFIYVILAAVILPLPVEDCFIPFCWNAFLCKSSDHQLRKDDRGRHCFPDWRSSRRCNQKVHEMEMVQLYLQSMLLAGVKVRLCGALSNSQYSIYVRHGSVVSVLPIQG